MNLIKKIFIIMLLCLPLGEVIRIDFGNGVVIKPLDIIISILVLTWMIHKWLNKERPKQKNIYIPVALFVVSGALSLLINFSNLSLGQFFVSLLYLIRWIAYAGTFFLMGDFDEKFKRVISKILFIVGSVIVTFGYIQYFFYSNLRNIIYLGWDEHMYRMFSVFMDPNFAGAFFVLFFLFVANTFLKKKSILPGIILTCTLGAVFLTFSRSALIMLIVASAMFFILIRKKLLIILVLTTVVVALSTSSRYFNIENINLFRVASSEARIETAKNAIQIIKDNPIFGVGFNAYRYTQFRYGLRNEINITSHADASSDNSLLFVLATTGIAGFILYIFLWFRISKIASFLAISSIVGVFVDSMFINSLFYPSIMLWIWMITSLSPKNN